MLDIYEVTVGRFRRFVESGAGTRANPPANGAGAHPQNPRTGWDPSFNEFLASTSRELARTLSDCGSYSTWREADFSNERRPINCVTWYEAFAFCVWDGGYLPTQAEFNFAAAGGDSQRVYPWGSGIDATRASYSEGFQTCNGDPGPGCSFRDLIFVGTRPAGNGRWGHADLAGNVREWLADGAGPLVTPCTDCIEATFTDRRSVGGGSFYDEPPVLQTQFRHDDPPRFGREWNGIRCARPLP
jgi:formylglycine-generating enzyme required for sulfatase activity